MSILEVHIEYPRFSVHREADAMREG